MFTTESLIHKVGKASAWIVGAAAALGILGQAHIRLLDLETSEAHASDIKKIREENARLFLGVEKRDVEHERQFKLLNGKLDCVVMEIPYQQCPAYQAEFIN